MEFSIAKILDMKLGEKRWTTKISGRPELLKSDPDKDHAVVNNGVATARGFIETSVKVPFAIMWNRGHTAL